MVDQNLDDSAVPQQRAPGWYDDDAAPGFQRWWSGESWTEHSRQAPQPAPPGVAAADAAEPGQVGEDARVQPAAESGAAVSLPTGPRQLGRFPVKGLAIALVAGALILAIGAVSVLLLVVRGSDSEHEFNGVVALFGDPAGGDIQGGWTACSGAGGYDDFSAGSRTSVTDGEGRTVGSLEVTNFDEASLQEMLDADSEYGFAGWGPDYEAASELLKDSSEFICLLHIEGTVQDADFYMVEFSHRGEFTFSRDDLEQDGWWIGLTLGS